MSGLPGSGKTTMIKRIAENKDGENTGLFHDPIIFDLDSCRSEEEMEDKVDGAYCWSSTDLAIIDGLFLTDEQRIKILNMVYTKLKSEYKRWMYPVIEIYEWNDDREKCLKNDNGRRERSSSISIKNLEFKPTDVEAVKKGLVFAPTCIEMNYQTVHVWNIREKVMTKGNWYKEKGKLVSESWCGGGTWGNCWGGSGTVSGESPVEFKELDNLLEELCPDISFLQYKKLMTNCVKIDEWYEHDYYGGSTINYRYICDLEKLGEYLEKLEER